MKLAAVLILLRHAGERYSLDALRNLISDQLPMRLNYAVPLEAANRIRIWKLFIYYIPSLVVLPVVNGEDPALHVLRIPSCQIYPCT